MGGLGYIRGWLSSFCYGVVEDEGGGEVYEIFVGHADCVAGVCYYLVCIVWISL